MPEKRPPPLPASSPPQALSAGAERAVVLDRLPDFLCSSANLRAVTAQQLSREINGVRQATLGGWNVLDFAGGRVRGEKRLS